MACQQENFRLSSVTRHDILSVIQCQSAYLSQRGDDEPECQRNLRNGRLVAVAPRRRARDTDRHQQHGAEELGDEHSPYVAVVCDVLNTDDFLHSWSDKKQNLINWRQ